MASMIAANRLKVAFDEGRQAFGCWQMIPGSNVSRTLARTGVDWVLVDQEHGNIDGAWDFLPSHSFLHAAWIGGALNSVMPKSNCIS
jgi:2-keto-3-deoxy-L-rhamnonate aldolase RhmA